MCLFVNLQDLQFLALPICNNHYGCRIVINIFENELEKGTGVPYLLIKNKVVEASDDVDSILLDNILNCRAYDPQVEGLRHKYLYSIVSIYGNREVIYEKILKAYDGICDTDWSDQQIFGFVCEMAKENKVDKRIVYEKIKSYIGDGKDDQYAMYYFAEDEGFCASEFIARELGKYYESHPGYEFCWYDGFFQDFKNKDEVISRLKKSEDRYIKIYMENIKESKKILPHKIKTAEEIIKKYFDEGKMFYPLGNWLEKVDGPERSRIAVYALECKNIELKYKILERFDKVKIPVDYGELKKEYLKTEELDHRISLLSAMLLLENPEVKELIYDLDFRNMDVLELFIKALCIFYSKEDDGILLEKIDSLDLYTCHSLIKFLLENENLKSNEGLYKKIVFKLYHKNKCSFCREDIFDAMVEFNFLDKTLCEELMHDCNLYIVNKAEKIYKEKF